MESTPVAAYAPPGVGMLAVGIVAEVFAPHGDAAPGFDSTLCGDRPEPVPTDVGVPLPRREYGAAMANHIARDMVLPSHREEGRPSTWPSWPGVP
ncbi:hypothetical protein ACWD1Z_33020 [Streptomyces sp. NPDC002784]